MFRKLFPALVLHFVLFSSAGAQLTNVEVLGGLAVKCLGDVPGDIDAFRLSPGTRMPYLRPFLTRHWISRGYTVLIGDSASAYSGPPIYELEYAPQAASVTYARADHDSLVRKVDLSISHSLISPQGVLVDEAHCVDSTSDLIRVTDVARLQQEPFEETRGVIPLDRGWRNWAEPAIIGTSLAVVVYLFFSVRSE